MVLKSQQNRSNAPSVRSLLVLCVHFSTLTVTIGWQAGHLAHKKFIPLISGGSVLEQVEEKNLRGNWLTQVHLEKTAIQWKQ